MIDPQHDDWQREAVEYDDFQSTKWVSPSADASLIIERGMGPDPSGFQVVYEQGDAFTVIDSGLSEREAVERAAIEAGVEL
jgi:glyoxylase-like metal-dependent hydrolase (beta-lactamase superfamily II)